MPRARCKESIEAEKRWRKGERLVDIARALKVPQSTVRRWKNTQDWGREKKSERSETKPSAKTSAKSIAPIPPKVDVLIDRALEENEELSEKQKEFCRIFIRNMNATQAYLRAYGCSYEAARTSGAALLANPRIKEELRHLREIKNAHLGDFCGEDLVELHMRIAFADMGDFLEWKSRRAMTMHQSKPVYFTDPKSKERKILTHIENELSFRDSSTVDGTLVSEVSTDRIKLEDRRRSLAFLERYFGLDQSKETSSEESGALLAEFARVIEEASPAKEKGNDDEHGEQGQAAVEESD
jgi:phage terminase small subunit